MTLSQIIVLFLASLFIVDAFPVDSQDQVVNQIRRQQRQMEGEQPMHRRNRHHQPEIVAEKERIVMVPTHEERGPAEEGHFEDPEEAIIMEKERVMLYDEDSDDMVYDDDEYYDEGDEEHVHDENGNGEAQGQENGQGHNHEHGHGHGHDHDKPAHFGKSIFADAEEGHLGQEKPAYCGGKPNEDPAEPEVIQKVNNDFDAIADAILQRRLANRRRSRDGPKPEPKIAKPRPSTMTREEAKLWNKKLGKAIGGEKVRDVRGGARRSKM